MEICQFKVILTLITFSILSNAGESRDLRPSEHGLAHQTSPATLSVGMTSFFGNTMSSSPPSQVVTGSPTDDWWPPPSKEDNKRLSVLKVAAIVCGGAGVILLVAAGLSFVSHFHKINQKTSGDGRLV